MTRLADLAGWAAVATFAVLAIWFDLRARRVPNWLVLAGLVVAIVLMGLGPVAALAPGWRDALLGGAIGFAVYLPLYAMGWMGAGDVKFFGVAGLMAWVAWAAAGVGGRQPAGRAARRAHPGGAPHGCSESRGVVVDACVSILCPVGRSACQATRHSVCSLYGCRAALPAMVA